MKKGPLRGRERLREAIRQAREGDGKKPLPDNAWGWAVEERLSDLEEASRWQSRVIVGALIGQFVLALLERFT